MSYTLLISRQAKKDIQEIYDYISEDNEDAAVRLVQMIDEKINTLKFSPSLGKEVQRRTKEYRCIISGIYKIYYQIREEEIRIFRVLHSAQIDYLS